MAMETPPSMEVLIGKSLINGPFSIAMLITGGYIGKPGFQEMAKIKHVDRCRKNLGLPDNAWGYPTKII